MISLCLFEIFFYFTIETMFKFLMDFLIQIGIRDVPVPFGVRKQIRQVKLVSLITRYKSRPYCEAIYGTTRTREIKDTSLCRKYVKRLKVLRSKAEKYNFKSSFDRRILFEFLEFGETNLSKYGRLS
eukprot:NODE_542_length_6882_cov_0.127967.p6 type:complete len:127 gc:universal NODE_542_length_6882_cov_0.127967:3487-3867(+)